MVWQWQRANGLYNFSSVLSGSLVYLEVVFIFSPFLLCENEAMKRSFLMEVVLNEVAGQCTAVFVLLSSVCHLHGRSLGAVFQVFHKSASEIN